MSLRRLLATAVLAGFVPHADASEIESEIEREVAPAAASLEHGKAATADASPVEVGALEAEVAYAPAWSGGAPAASDGGSTHAWTFTATYGVAPDVDVRVGGGAAAIHDPTHVGPRGVAVQDGSGLGDLSVGARWRFLNLPRRGLELAVVGQATIPVGSRDTATQVGVSQGYWSGRLALVATKDVGRLTLDGEVACTVPLAGDARALSALPQVNVAVGYHLRPWLQPEIELNHQSWLGQGAHAVAVTAGVVVPWGRGHRVVAAVQQTVATWSAPAATGAIFAYKAAF